MAVHTGTASEDSGGVWDLNPLDKEKDKEQSRENTVGRLGETQFLV